MRRLAGALILLLVGGLPLFGAPSASAATVALSASTWDVDLDSGRVTYSVRLDVSGLRADVLPCDGAACVWQVHALYHDGGVEQVQHALGSGSYSGSAGSFSRTFAAEGATLAEVTHLRARVWPSTGTVADGSETSVEVSDPYPPGGIDLHVAVWGPDVDTGRVSYDLTVSWRGAGGVGEPCEAGCSWHVVTLYRDDDGERVLHGLANGSRSGRTWTHEFAWQREGAALGEVTHLRARVWPSGGSLADGYETTVEVSDPYPSGSIDVHVDAWARTRRGRRGRR